MKDANGLAHTEFSYQWKRSNGVGPEQPVPGATGKSYQVREEDVGTQMKVEVEFTDDAGYPETVESKARVVEEEVLFARLNDAPAEHDGAGAFTVRLLLSEVLDETAPGRPRASSFEVTGGSVEQVRRRTANTRSWEVTVRPSSDAEVVVAVPLREACEEAGAICTVDGRVLSGALSVTVPGPLTVSVSDARAEETASTITSKALRSARAGPLARRYCFVAITGCYPVLQAFDIP